jgi:glycosyltransferase involved in cell wall biosynthesis
MELNPRNIKIGIVDLKEIGGRKTFIDNFYKCLKKYGYNVSLINLTNITVKELNKFDILHFSNIKGVHKIFLLNRNVKKILTIHGWINEEVFGLMRHEKFHKKVGLLVKLFLWKILPIFFDAIVYPTEDTANKNKFNGTVISNGIFIDEYKNIKSKDLRNNKSEIVFISYSSPGGLKEWVLNKTIDIVNDLNKIFTTDKKVTLFIFGNVLQKIINNDNIIYMGYREDFLEIIKSADIFITAKDFPDLGYVEMEAGMLEIPVAKFISGDEEIKDGVTGILAKNEDEMVKKLDNYISNLEYNKGLLGHNFKKYIIDNKSWDVLINEWEKLFNKLLSTK